MLSPAKKQPSGERKNMNKEYLDLVSYDRLRKDLFHLCRDPFSFRCVTYTAPWHTSNSLDETDEFIAGEMKKYASCVRMIPYKLRPLRCDSTKPLHHWYSAPLPDDPFYDGNCIEVLLPGSEYPEEIIQLVSHKDSMSWINSPGAHDNAVGTVANMELVRVLSQLPLKRSVRVLFCNEEHSPWYSRPYADEAFKRGDRIIAVMNQDSLCGKSDEAMAAGLSTFVSVYSTEEGKPLAEFLGKENEKYEIGLTFSAVKKQWISDDDGSFILAGYPRTVMSIGSFPYGDSQYHLPGDVPERVNIINLGLSAKLILAAVMDLDEMGEEVFAQA